MKKIGEPVNLPKEFAGFSIRYNPRNGNAFGAKEDTTDRGQPFTVWCGDEVIFFTNVLNDATAFIRAEKYGNK